MAGSTAHGQPVISLNDLQNIKRKFEEDLVVLTDSIQKLQAIQQHFLASQEHTKQMETIPDGAEVLVPLCDGLLVRGKAVDVGVNLVDIGAGYFVEMSQEKTRDYCKRRVEFLNAQLSRLQSVGQEKMQQRQMVISAMQQQMAQMKLTGPRAAAGSIAAR
ncbi:hypothetical protein RvY_07123 [Ramazzottius varieornatus]|uniref:Prefoldin subunit 5 n=1 Tax=Ramazzottius varieornatus TaxID=947166 RepID=A0A1D1V196_RAMVA|nr:hypothetical protein RvY_07123 [Ramazzottius varieornatus]